MTVTGDKRSCLTVKTGTLEAGDGEMMEIAVAGLLGLTVCSDKAKEDNGRTGAMVRFSSQFLVLGGESEPPKK